MATWPATLPRPQVPGYAMSMLDPVARSKFDFGANRARERSTAPPTQIQVRFAFTEEELAVFESWFRHEALDGAAWCAIPLTNGQGVANVDALFSDDWRTEAAATGFIVSATLHVRSMPIA